MDKLKIFISGTQDDMQPEREAASRAIDSVALATGIRAEETLSQLDPPREWIEQQITNCNIYLGIYSHRYGWVVSEEKLSVTELEFRLARQAGKPILVWARTLRDAEKGLPDFERQQEFLKRVGDFSSGYMRQEFENTVELEHWIADALRETFIEIINRQTMHRSRFPTLPDHALVAAYLKELAKQKPYVLWSHGNYIDRTVAKTDDFLVRTVTRYDPRILEKAKATKPELLEKVLAREGKLVLLGEPGIGKTTCLLHLAWEAANRSQVLINSTSVHNAQVPIYVELKYYKGEEELEKLLARRINDVVRRCNFLLAPDLAESTSTLKAWLMQTEVRFLLLLDGLNEVRPEFNTAVRGLLGGLLNSSHGIVIACRERDYDQSLRDHASAFILQRLQKDEIRIYLRNVLGNKGDRLFYRQIHRDSKMQTLVANPLMLWLISIVAQDDPDAKLPPNRGKLFERFTALMPRLRRGEGITVKVPLDVVAATLAQLGFEMQDRGRLTAELGDARTWRNITTGWQLEDILSQAKEWRFLKSDGKMGELIEFLHQLFLEYFAAAYLDSELRKGKTFSEVFSERLFTNQWSEIVFMLAGISDRPVSLVKWLSAQVIAKKQWRAATLVSRCYETSPATDDDDARSAVADMFIAALQDEDIMVRWNAAEALGEIADPRAVEPLIAAPRDEDAVLRRLSAEALVRLPDPRAVKPLSAALRDKNPRVRAIAAQALVKIADERAVEALINALQRENDIGRADTVEALGEIADPRAVESLILVLRDERRYVRKRATEALVKIGTPAIQPLMTALLNEDTVVRKLAAEALMIIANPATVEPLYAILRLGDVELRKVAVDALVKIGSPAVDSLIVALQQESWMVRRLAAEALGEVADSRAVEPLIVALQDEDRYVCWLAAESLGEIADPRAVEPLISVLADEDSYMQKRAVEALVKIGATAVRSLVDALRYGDRKVRNLVTQAVIKINAPVLPLLLAAVRDEREKLSQLAAEGGKRMASQRGIETLITAMRDEDIYVRELASDALATIGTPAVESLIAALEHEDAVLRNRAAKTLAKVGAPVVELLTAALQDENSSVRQRATKVLITIGADVLNLLIDALRDERAAVRWSVTEVLGEIADRRAVEPLISALKDQNEIVRVNAIEALGKIGDSRAVEQLIDALGNESEYVRVSAVEALERIGDLRALPQLRRMRREHNIRMKSTLLADAAQKAVQNIRRQNRIRRSDW